MASHRPARTIPRMSSTIERRVLVNYRVDPAVAQTLLPPGLRPQLVAGSAVAGVCLIRLGSFRPTWFRPQIGHRSENAAHRIAVEWDTADGARTGVFIPRRHSSSIVARTLGGRAFPGTHARAAVAFRDTDDGISVHVDADDLRVDVAVRLGQDVRFQSELFGSLAHASDFFRKDSVGWSPTRSGTLEGVRLDTTAWRVEPTAVTALQSTFFDALPPGSATFDHALVMRDVPAEWTSVRQPAPAENQ